MCLGGRRTSLSQRWVRFLLHGMGLEVTVRVAGGRIDEVDRAVLVWGYETPAIRRHLETATAGRAVADVDKGVTVNRRASTAVGSGGREVRRGARPQHPEGW